MCGRFSLTGPDPLVIADVFGATDVPELPARYNIAPTQPVATVVHDRQRGVNRVEIMRWGLIPSWAKDPAIGNRMINARADTLPEKPSYRGPLRCHRCLILADGFYEWQAGPDGKQPMFIHLKDRALFGLAGLWDVWRSPDGTPLITCTIITTEPNALMAEIHNRMPVILPREDFAAWLDPQRTDAAQVMPLLRPYPAEEMACYPVSRRVNSPANDDPTLIERAG
jgi:putative SOS response-associated peptidase YedK